MKTTLLLFAFAVSVAFAAVDIRKPIPELRLNGGRVLKNVEMIAFASSAVTAKWEGGRGTIAYDELPGEIRQEAEKRRPAPSVRTVPPPKPQPDAARQRTAPPPAPTAEKSRSVSGQVFITTRGAGAYRFSGAQVVAYPMTALEQAQRVQRMYAPGPGNVDEDGRQRRSYEAWVKALSEHSPCGVATTDADGAYTITLRCDDPAFLFCYTTRIAAGRREHNLWVVPVSGERVDLSGENETPL